MSIFELGAVRTLMSLTFRLVGLVVVVGLFACLYRYQANYKKQQDNQVRVVPSDRIEETESTEEPPSAVAIRNLILDSELLVDDSALDLPTRIHNLQKRIQIAEKILTLDPEPDADAYATWSNLVAMVQLEKLNTQFKMGLTKTRETLHEIADAHVDSSVAKIARIARTAKAFGSVLDYRDATQGDAHDDESCKQLRSTAVENFQIAAEITMDDFTSAILLWDIARIANESTQKARLPELFDLFSRYGSNSSNSAISDRASIAKTLYLKSRWQFTRVTNAIGGDLDRQVNELSGQIDNLLALPEVEVDDYALLPNSIENVVRVGRHDTARELVEKVLKRIGNEPDFSDVTDELQNVMTWLNLLGKPLSIEGIVDVDGNPAKLDPNHDIHALMFVSAERQERCEDARNRALSVLRDSIDAKQASLAVISIDHEPDGSKLQTLHEKWPDINVWKIGAQPGSGSQFLERVPIPGAPFLIVLNKNNELIAIDPTLHEFELKVIVLTQANR